MPETLPLAWPELAACIPFYANTTESRS